MQSQQLGVASLILAPSTSASTTEQSVSFSTYVNIENIYIRSNGDLFLSTLDNTSLFETDSFAPDPQAKLTAELAPLRCAELPALDMRSSHLWEELRAILDIIT